MVNDNLLNKKVRAFILEGKRLEVKQWNDVLIKVFEILFEKHKDELISLAQQNKIRGRDNIYLSTEIGKITGTPLEIKPGLFLEIKFNAPFMIETCVKFLSEFNYQDFKIETSDGLLFSAIPPINEPIKPPIEENYFILRTGGSYPDVPSEKYFFKSGIPGYLQLKDSNKNGKFVYLENGKFYAIGEIGQITSEEKEGITNYTMQVLNFQDIPPVEYETIKQKIGVKLNIEGIRKITKEQFDGIVTTQQIRYWVVLPLSYTLGRLDVWQKWKSLGIVNIMWKNLEKNLGNKLLNFSSYKEYVSEYRKIYPDTQADMVWNFIYKMKEGDVILVSRGHKTILGRGIIKSPAKIFDKSRIDSTNQDILSDMLIHREVKWEEFNPEFAIPQEVGRKFSRSVRALDKSDYDKIFSGVPELEKRPPAKPYPIKQIILYGPPGTGKTYSSIIKAHEIIFGEIDKTITYQTLLDKLQDVPKNDNDVSQLSWLEAIVLAFDKLQKDKVQVDEIKNSKIIQDFSSFKNNHSISNTIWYILQTESKIESELVKSKNKSGRELFDKDTESNWYLTEKGKMYQQSLIEDLNDIPQSSDAQFKFVTFHQSFSYEDFIEGIRPTLDDTEESKIVYKVKDGIFKEICKKASLDPDKNYVLIIDEINRGNISKIFGELITLLEDNKRAGEKEAITVRLPYSGQDFSVPNNVYIIGTMNSTDKSIALVDVALRRRFHFERVNIRNDLIKNEDANKFLSGLNGMIRAIKNPDFEIGHSYFIDIPKNDEGNQELRKIFKNKILPLIEEYFFNDWEALATILGTDSIRVEKRKKLVWDEDLGEFKKESEEFDRISGRCIDYNKDIFENTRKNLENQQTSLEINKIT